MAYTDDDAYPDPHWLLYLCDMFLSTSHAGIGGPNLAPLKDGWIADCVANAPGGPIHVLLTDQTAEHIPGCNMAFRKQNVLLRSGGLILNSEVREMTWISVGGYKPKGWTLGFHPSAMVWHHRRNSVRTYWKQQRGYGKAEALLERKWPEKYNASGHLCWAGRLYGRGVSALLSWQPSRVYQGVWGSAPFQRLYEANPTTTLSVLSMPEWNLGLIVLTLLSLLGVVWPPLLWGWPILALFLGTTLVLAIRNAKRGTFEPSSKTGVRSP